MDIKRTLLNTIIFALMLTINMNILRAQVDENAKRYIRIGELQSHFTAYGSERAWNNSYYEGLRWPADYSFTDNAVIKRAWVAIKDYTDENGFYWDTWANYIYSGYVTHSLFPMELKQTAKFDPPTVYVDGVNITAPYSGDVDAVNPNQIPDRIVNNVVNMSCGLTMTRRVLAFSQPYHDNYFIKEYVFTNTGNTDYDAEIELSDSLRGLRVGWGTRYSVCREGAANSDNQQSWGKHSWVTRRGENYATHAADVKAFTEDTPLDELDWIRGAFSWLGQSEVVTYDMIGAPDMNGKGRLTAPQFAGSAVLHVDKSVQDRSDDPQQPVFLGWHAGDTYPSIGDLRETDQLGMSQVYDMLSGNPYPNEDKGGTDRFYEENTNSITHKVDPYTIHNDGGGTNVMLTYGPWDLGPGDSIKFVEVEGISGLSRPQCEDIGRRWLTAYRDDSDNGPFELPPDGRFPVEVNYGGTTDDEDLYKNAWVYTGMDSILLTFSRAIRNYNMDYQIPQPPEPPPVFEINSGGDKIMLSWVGSPSESNANFGGYRIYRAVGKPDTLFDRIADLPPGEEYFEDKTANRGFSYYYYIVSYTDGSQNSAGVANPTGVLESSRFYTKTNKAAYLRRKAGTSLQSIRIVPNPYNFKARNKYQYTGEPDKIMFLDIPAYCKIRIYTERGDLIKTISHEDGSGDETWNSITSSRQVVVSGVYIAHFEVTKNYPAGASGDELMYRKGDEAIEKFVIIR